MFRTISCVLLTLLACSSNPTSEIPTEEAKCSSFRNDYVCLDAQFEDVNRYFANQVIFSHFLSKTQKTKQLKNQKIKKLNV